MSARGGGWRLPVRLAWREALRARGRSVLVLVMIALPVLGVTLADTVFATQRISGGEALERRLGTAEALVVPQGGGRVLQGFDPESSFSSGGGPARGNPAPELDGAAIARSLDEPGLSTVPLESGLLSITTDRGRAQASALTTDLADPLTTGLVRLSSGRLPSAAGEVAVNAALAARGPGIGEDLVLGDGSSLRVVGLAESPSSSSQPFVVAVSGALTTRYGQPGFLVGGSPVSWAQVRALNRLGASVVSRSVLTDPPPDSELPPQIAQIQGSTDAATLTAAALVVTMILIEVVLLAGPAFAVGARRQSRTLALMAAAGGSPRDARRVVLASGLVLGTAASVLGLLLGILGARALMPLVQRLFDTAFGPFEVTWTHLAAVAALGLASAMMAAAVPAWIASRQDVVAVLAGRRGDARPSRRSPVVGLVLLGAGIALAAYGARLETGGEVYVAGSAIVCVLGMLLLAPVVVAVTARLASRLPLSLRFAARDAARHRTRTVPAVAAVAATVAGVVALGIAISSDAAQSEADYQPLSASGTAVVSLLGAGAPTVTEVTRALGASLPDATISEVRSVAGSHGFARGVSLRVPGAGLLLSGAGSSLGGDVLVAADGLPLLITADLSADERRAASQVLADGGLVAFTDRGVQGDEARLSAAGRTGGSARSQAVDVPAVVISVPPLGSTIRAVLSPQAAEQAGLETTTGAVLASGSMTATQQQDATEAVAALSGRTTLYVERGYQVPPEVRIVELVLGGLGAVLMLGGTLTATFLALSDARPDLATLSAVGASRRTRRSVAAAYALVVGVVGSLLGTLVGLVPGIAVSYPLTRPFDLGGGTLSGPSHYLAFPWPLMAVIVLGLPVLTAVLVALTARGRLPMVARLD